MEVHPPEHPIHTWRDFFIHIATIVVGLLIAIALEQSVEAIHHRHMRHTAERNLGLELAANRKTLAMDEEQLKSTVKHLRETVNALGALRAHTKPAQNLSAQWDWDDLASGAWDTARETQATSLMSYDEVQRYTDLYAQQAAVNSQATVYIRSVYHIGTPVELGKPLDQLTPADIDHMQAGIENSISEVSDLLDLCRSLDVMYASGPGHNTPQ